MKRLLERGIVDETKPLLFGVGVALAAPVAGYSVARAVSRVSKATTVWSASGHKRFLSDTIGCSRGIKDELRILQNEQASANIIWSTSRILTKSSRNGEKQESQEALEQTAKEHEIASLKNLIQDLQKKEEILEIELLTYDGLREQEAAVRELENRLRLSSAETERLLLELNSLEDENQKLKLQASEHLEAMKELESTKSEAKQLEGKLAYIRVCAKEKITLLEQKLTSMLDEQKNEEDKLNRLKELEDEAEELRRVNLLLEEENGDLNHRIKSASTNPSSTLQTIQTEILEEISQLREENEELKNKIEQLKSDHFEDVEELIYLRWLNACLRYELSNSHMISSGKTTALDLSKNFNPQSEQKAKELIHEYANESMHENTRGLDCHGLTAERTTHQCNGSTTPTTTNINFSIKKDKFFGKLKKIVMSRKNNKKVGLESLDDRNPSGRISQISTKSISSYSFDEARRYSSDSTASCLMVDHLIGGIEFDADDRWEQVSPWIQTTFRSPFSSSEARRFDREGEEQHKESRRRPRKSEQGAANAIGFRRMNQADGHENSKKPQPKKFSEVSVNTRAPKEINKRRSASFVGY